MKQLMASRRHVVVLMGHAIDVKKVAHKASQLFIGAVSMIGLAAFWAYILLEWATMPW